MLVYQKQRKLEAPVIYPGDKGDEAILIAVSYKDALIN
jgi:hypothetical protein